MCLPSTSRDFQKIWGKRIYGSNLKNGATSGRYSSQRIETEMGGDTVSCDSKGLKMFDNLSGSWIT